MVSLVLPRPLSPGYSDDDESDDSYSSGTIEAVTDDSASDNEEHDEDSPNNVTLFPSNVIESSSELTQTNRLPLRRLSESVRSLGLVGGPSGARSESFRPRAVQLADDSPLVPQPDNFVSSWIQVDSESVARHDAVILERDYAYCPVPAGDQAFPPSVSDVIGEPSTLSTDGALLSPSTAEPFSKHSSLCLDGQITNISSHVVVSGGYADVWTGSLGSRKVAIKTMRAFSSMGTPIKKAKLLKRLWREYLAWSCLSHPNILQCLGFSYDFSPQSNYEVPSLISPWMANGTVLFYIEKNPQADRLMLLVGIAQGLSYLHNRDPSIVHGDLRAGNILVSDSGVPFLTDFGLSRTLGDVGMTTSSDVAGSLRWMSPELFRIEKASETSDVWAYGMTVLEIVTGKRPYYEFTLDPVVLREIMDGRIPSRPPSPTMTDDLWNVCRRCWNPRPMQRPSMREVTLDIMAELHVQQRRQWNQKSSGWSTPKPRSLTPPAPRLLVGSRHRRTPTQSSVSAQWRI